MGNSNGLCDPAGKAEAVHHVGDQIHVIRQIAQLLINVKRLGKEEYNVPVMALKLKIVADLFFKRFEIPVVPDHADLIHQKDGIFRKKEKSNITGVKVVCTGDIRITVDLIPLFGVFNGLLAHEC